VQGHSNLKMDKEQTILKSKIALVQSWTRWTPNPKSMNPISFVHAYLTFFFAI